MAECADKTADFKFCLTMRSLSPEERRDAWLRHRAEWWATRRTTQSSEDVWEVRKYAFSCLFLVDVCVFMAFYGYRKPLEGFPPPPIDLSFEELTDPTILNPPKV